MTRAQIEIHELAAMYIRLYGQKPTLTEIARLKNVQPYAIKMQLIDVIRDLIK